MKFFSFSFKIKFSDCKFNNIHTPEFTQNNFSLLFFGSSVKIPIKTPFHSWVTKKFLTLCCVCVCVCVFSEKNFFRVVPDIIIQQKKSANRLLISVSRHIPNYTSYVFFYQEETEFVKEQTYAVTHLALQQGWLQVS